MITTKLHKQLREEVDYNRDEIIEIKEECQREMKAVMSQQQELVKEKSFKIADYAQRKLQITKEHEQERNMTDKLHKA